MNLMETLYWNFKTEIKDIQGVLLPDRQTLRDDSRHENKHYLMGNHRTQTSSVEVRGH